MKYKFKNYEIILLFYLEKYKLKDLIYETKIKINERVKVLMKSMLTYATKNLYAHNIIFFR